MDALKNTTETFTYDATLNNRLAAAQIGSATVSVNYLPNGNINSKSDIGTYQYDGTKNNALASVSNSNGLISSGTQNIAYTPFNKANTIAEADKQLKFTYGPQNERRLSELYSVSTNTKLSTRYFIGDYEKTIDQTSGAVTEVNYINCGDNLVGMYVTQSGSPANLYFVYTDHLGSILTVTNTLGTVVAEQSFDAWGNYRNPNTWHNTNIPTQPTWLYRGYTGHEHLNVFGLINMNGRMYDPLLGRMLSPDNFVQDNTSTQGYNRYSYVLNNPLKYTDPTGELFVIDDLILGAIGGTVNLLTNLGNVHSFGQGLGYFGVGFAGGALSTYITPMGSAALVGAGNAALGSYINTGRVDAGAVIQGAVVSGIVGGVTMGIGGALSPVADKALSGIASPVLRGAITQGVVGAGLGGVGGGLGAAMNGGDFWQGVGQGALWGGGIGLATGAYSGYSYAKSNNLNPWTGESTLKPSPQISTGTFTKGQIRSNVPGDYDIALQEWNNIQNQYGVTPTQGVPSGFTTTLPDGSVVSGQFYYGGGVNPTGYNIKVNMTPPPPTINKIPPIHIRYDWR